MNGASGFHEVRFFTSLHHQIAPCRSNSINSGHVPGSSMLTISPRSPQTSAQSQKVFLFRFCDPRNK